MSRFSLETWVVLVLLALLVAAGIFLARGADDGAFNTFPTRSTYSAQSSGYKALFMLLEKAGTKPLRRGWKELPAQTRILFVVSPRIPPVRDEWEGLRPWIARGGLLVVAPGQEYRVPPNSQPEWIVAYPTVQEGLMEGVPSISVYRYPPSLLPLPFMALSERLWPDPFPLASHDDRALISLARYGEGAVILLNAPEMLSNDGLQREANLRLALNLLAWRGVTLDGPSGAVVFDEYHHGHGYGEDRSLWQQLPPVMRDGLIGIGIAGLIWIWAVSRRLGAAVPLRAPPRVRSEYLESMATLLERAHAVRLAARTRARTLRDRLSRTLGLGVMGTSEELTAAVGATRPDLAREAAEILAGLERMASAPNPSAGDLLRLARREASLLQDLKKGTVP